MKQNFVFNVKIPVLENPKVDNFLTYLWLLTDVVIMNILKQYMNILWPQQTMKFVTIILIYYCWNSVEDNAIDKCMATKAQGVRSRQGREDGTLNIYSVAAQ